MNLAHLIERNALIFPNAIALSHGEVPFATHAELAQRVRSIAYHLQVTRRLPRGSRIGIAMRNMPQFWEVLFGAWYAGMVAVPINPKLHPREIDYILGHSGASLCFTSSDLGAGIAAIGASSELKGVIAVDDDEYLWMCTPATPFLAMAPCAPADIAWLFYTSGTTGQPKGAMLSHRNLLAMIYAYFADLERIEAADSIIHAAPQSHGSGLWGLVHFARGANNVVPESGGFDAGEIAFLLDRYPGVTMFAAPTMVNRLVDSSTFMSANLDHLKAIVYGGAPMYLADIRRALDGLGPKLAQIYGQGESPMTITALPKEFHEDDGDPGYLDRLASVGFARTGVEVRVVDPEGHALESGDVGEVVVRGDVVMSGYWRDERATASALRDGWLYTGDVGAFDGRGFLTLLDRTKDMIISGGSNIYPREVEEVLLAHPSVREVSVIGLPSPEWGEEVVAFVATNEGKEISPDELDNLCLEHIARYKRPKQYIFVESLPKSSNGKILKTRLREIMTDAK
jgi:long-chain acyl-CoA synthetase